MEESPAFIDPDGLLVSDNISFTTHGSLMAYAVGHAAERPKTPL